jgi:hypothetical protein
MDYIPPQKYIAPQVKVPTDGKYPLVTPEIPVGVIVEGDMLGNIVALKFAVHDITYEQKFPKLEREKYLCCQKCTKDRSDSPRTTDLGDGD